jgi:hypothetical protein
VILISQIPLFCSATVTIVWLFSAIAVIFCLWRQFATIPSFAVDTFGPRIWAVFTANPDYLGIAGVLGPMMMEHQKVSG